MTVQYLTIPEVAKRLGVSRRTVYNYIKNRFIRENGRIVPKYEFTLLANKLPSGDMRVSTTQLKQFMTWCRQKAEREQANHPLNSSK